MKTAKSSEFLSNIILNIDIKIYEKRSRAHEVGN